MANFGSLRGLVPAELITELETDAATTDITEETLDGNKVSGSIGTLTDGATITPDASVNGYLWEVTIAGDRTMANPINVSNGASFILEITQGAGGTHLINTWGSNWQFPGGAAPTLSTAAGAVDSLGGYISGGKLRVLGVALDIKDIP